MGVVKFLQRSLFGQVIAILIATLLVVFVLLQILIQSTLIFSLSPKVMERHARITVDLIELVESVPPETQQLALANFSSSGRAAKIADQFPTDAITANVFTSSFDEEFGRRAVQPNQSDVRYRIIRRPQLESAQQGVATPVRFTLLALEVSVEMRDGRVLTTFMSPSAIFEMSDLWQVLFIPAVFVIAAGLALRQGFKPLRALETAANSLGRTTKPIHVDVKGTDDVRRVARALNDMQVRVQTLLADRTRMVAAMAHDIRTILTQLKLRLDGIDEDQATRMEADVDLMERLVSDMLIYARAEQPTTQPELINVNEFLKSFSENLAQPPTSEIDKEPFWIVADGAALTRALNNLCENAAAYAGNFKIATRRTSKGLCIDVLDRGPGIPEADLEHVFDPFFRGEKSRSRETGGTGLGLAIARSLLSAQGATLSITNLDGGGTRASITFVSTSDVS